MRKLSRREKNNELKSAGPRLSPRRVLRPLFVVSFSTAEPRSPQADSPGFFNFLSDHLLKKPVTFAMGCSTISILPRATITR